MNGIDYIKSVFGGSMAPVNARPYMNLPQTQPPQTYSTGGGFGTPGAPTIPPPTQPMQGPTVGNPMGDMGDMGGGNEITVRPRPMVDGGFHRTTPAPQDGLVGPAVTGGGFGGGKPAPGIPLPPQRPSDLGASPGGVSPPNEITVTPRPSWMPQDAWRGPGAGGSQNWYTGGNPNSDHQDRINSLGDGSGPKFNGFGDFVKNISKTGQDTGTAGVGLFQKLFGI